MAFPTRNNSGWNIRPGFVGDFLNREHVLPGGVKLAAASFPGDDSLGLVVGAAGAAANATSIPLTVALTQAIPANTVLTFGAADAKKFARLSANAATGATALTVQPLATALVSGDAASYLPHGERRRVAAGTPVKVDRDTFEGAAADGLEWSFAGNGAAAAATDIVRVIAYDVQDVDDNNDADLLRKGTLLRCNHMYWSTLSATVKAVIRADYEVTVGTPGQEVAAD